MNSFGIEARAGRLVEWKNTNELKGAFSKEIAGSRWMALGGGNNILFTRDYDGVLVKSAAKKIEIIEDTADKVFVRADAGVDWDKFVAWCVARGLWGVENLSGIPGTAGAAPIQNIGAYGAEVRDVIRSVEYFSVEEAKVTTIAGKDCGFGYRDSVFKRDLKGKVVITAVDFELSKTARPNLKYGALAEKVEELGGANLENIRHAVTAIRDSKLPDPRVIGNAGSFFKNPVVDTAVAQKLLAQYPEMPIYPAGEEGKTKLAAGWLIEQAGWKGRNEGHVGIHPGQALIVVNLGGATGREIVEFSQKVQAAVCSKFGVGLETEVNIV